MISSSVWNLCGHVEEMYHFVPGKTTLSHKRSVTLPASDEPLYYHSYLGLDQLLSSQKLMSAPANVPPESGLASGGASPAAPSEAQQAAAAGCPFHKAALDSAAAAAAGDDATAVAAPPAAVVAAGSEDAERLEAANRGGAHDEHLFIIIHQAFELWFKQVLWEVGDAQRLLGGDFVPERDVGTVISRLNRVVEIFRLLVEQFTILETMTPLGFLEFRD